MRRRLLALLCVFIMSLGSSQGQILIPNTTAVKENFDGMAATKTLPSGWRMGVNTSSPVFSTGVDTVMQQSSSGTPSTAGTYNWGSTSSERAVGVMTSGSFASPNSLMALYKNTSSNPLTSLNVSYIAERYRINTAAASIQFYYSRNGSTWTAVTAGDIAAASFPTGSSSYTFSGGTVVRVSSVSISSLTLAPNDSIYLRWNLNTTGSSSQGIGIDSVSVTAAFSTTPTISSSGTTNKLRTTYGTASSSDSFNVSGVSMSAGITVTPTSNFEVASTIGGSYGSSVVIGSSGVIASTKVFYRIKSSTIPGRYLDTLTLSSSGATNVKVAMASDTVYTKALTITGLTGTDKVYDRSTTATLIGTAAVSGLVGSDAVTLGGSASSLFATATVGTAKTITTTGYTITGGQSAYYTLTQPTGLTANITAKALTVSGASASDKTYDGTRTATITGASLVGVISPDVVTLSGGGTFSDSIAGIGKSVSASMTLSGAAAANYSLTQPTGLTATINKANQTISFSALASKTTSSAPFTLTATASSGLEVSYASSDASVATNVGSTLTIIGEGSTIITASQAGNDNYNAARDTTQTQVVTTGPLAAWDVNGLAGGASPQTASEKNTHVTVVGLTRGSGLTASSTSNCWGATSFNTATSSSTAISNSDFTTFSIVADAGYKMSLTSIPSYNIRRSSSGPTSGQWQYKAGTGSYVDLGSVITWGSTTSSAGNTQAAITLSGITALQDIDSVTFRIVPYNASGTGGTWNINDPSASTGNDFQVNGTVVNGCTPATKLMFTTQPVASANINQGSAFNVVVSAVCADGIVASSINTGTVTIDFSGCGLDNASYTTNTKTANIINGIATFNSLVVSRSVQSGVYFTTTNTLGLTDTSSNRFNIIAPAGTTTHDTLKNDNFSTAPMAWSYSTGTPVVVGSGGSSGSDRMSVVTSSGNSFLRKSYSADNSSGERGTTNTVTFANVSGLGSYSTTDLSFKVASLVGSSESGAGNDVDENLSIDISTDGGSTWTTILTHEGGSNKQFPFSSTSPYTLSTSANTTFSSASSQSSFVVTLPASTSQFRFRMTATNNRTSESWAIDDLLLIGHLSSAVVSSPLPTVSVVGGDIVCGPPYNATLTSTITNNVGTLSYRWYPGASLADSTVASPVASPAMYTTYSLEVTDSVGCVATSVSPAIVSFHTPEILLVNTTTTSSGYCDAADGYRYYQVAGSSPAAYFFAIKWDADGDNVVDAAAKAASTVTVTVAGAPFSSTASSNEHGSVLMQRYWDVNVAGNTMTEPVDVKFYYDPIEKSSINATRDANKVAADLLTPFTLSDVPFSWFKTVGMPMNATAIAAINGNDFTPINALVLTDANTLSATDNSVLYAQFNNVMSFSGGTGGVGFAPYSGVSLPIELISFTALANNAQVDLKWITATEINNDFFSIERSKDGIHFEVLSTQKGAGNSTETRVYTSVDNQPLSGISYYRLKQTDFDGQFSYSKIQSVNMVSISETMITHYPNPVEEAVKFVYGSNSNTTATYIVYDAVGKVVSEGSQKAKIGQNDLVINFATLSNGVYLIQMNIDGKIITEKFLKQ